MKTDDLVAMLATGVTPVPPHAASRPMGLALLLGVPVSLAMLLLGFGVRRDLLRVIDVPMFWLKLAFPLCIALAAFVVVQRLARPGVPVRRAWWALVAPVAMVFAMALGVWFATPEQERLPSLMGVSWRTCAASISLMALPIFALALLALKRLAPTQPALAGAAAGALAGGLGAAIYALYCVEMAAPFLAVWYTAGMLVPVLAGALLGRRWLRW
ncbi:MAG: DUF1109 domain-containing protein [Polaromonas sp.]